MTDQVSDYQPTTETTLDLKNDMEQFKVQFDGIRQNLQETWAIYHDLKQAWTEAKAYIKELYEENERLKRDLKIYDMLALANANAAN